MEKQDAMLVGPRNTWVTRYQSKLTNGMWNYFAEDPGDNGKHGEAQKLQTT